MQKIHILFKNENISKLASVYNVDEKDITISKDLIMGKSYAIIKNGSDDVKVILNYFTPIIYKSKSGDNFEKLSSYGFEVSANKFDYGDYLLLSKKSDLRYVVKPLEKLDDVAKKFKTSKEEIILENSLKTEKLYIGQILWI